MLDAENDAAVKALGPLISQLKVNPPLNRTHAPDSLDEAIGADLAELWAHWKGYESNEPSSKPSMVRRHFPEIAAIGRLLRQLVEPLIQRGRRLLAVEQHTHTPAPTTKIRGAMINFGYSGGMLVGTTGIIPERWEDINAIMNDLQINWFFGIAVRCAPETNLAAEVPSFNYLMFGPRAISFGAVAVFVSSSHLDQVVHLPELSKTVSTCWVQVGTHIFGGFSIPPRRRGINEALRLDAVSVLFTEYDQAAKFLASPDAAVHIAGDVNPGDDIDATFAEELRKRGLCHSFDETTPTHAKGRRLDAVCSRPKSALSPPQVHNGGHCKTTGCTSPICGRRKETFQSADLDHDPVSWATMADASDPPCVWRVKWNSDLGKWHAAETAFASPVLELVAADLDTNLRSSRLEDLTQKEAAAIVDSTAVVWRTCLIMTGATAGLASVPGTKGRHQSSPEVAAAHRAFMNALRACRHGKASREDVTTARREWRAAATNDRAQQRLDVQECILEAASRNEQQVATVLKRLNAKPDHGLPAYMLDPLDANNVLVGITDVLDGAKRYIEARGNPIREKYWDADHTKKIETKLKDN